MALYQLLKLGVLKTDTGQRIVPACGSLWDDYQAWLAAGNIPDPYIPPPQPDETLEEAKKRRAYQIRMQGLTRMQTRFEGLRSFEMVRLVREVVLSIAPAARQLTADITWLGDTYQAGRDAIDDVQAATTIAQVDAVTPAWPQ